MEIIYFPFHSWTKCEAEGFRTRDAHILLEFEKSPDVSRILVVDRPVSLAEIIGRRRHRKPGSGHLIYRKRNSFLTQVSEKIHVLDVVKNHFLSPIYQRQKYWINQYKKPYLTEAISEALAYLDFQNHLLFLANPFSCGIIGKLGEQMVVFDAIDNLLKHSYLKNVREEVEKSYDFLKKNADIIFANSDPLTLFMKEGRSNVFCIRNGVNGDFFKEYPKGDIPGDMKTLKRPIIGYAGKINKRLNIDLMKFLIEKLPDVNFVFIGQMMDSKWFKPLLKFPNLHYLGDKHYNKLPGYLSSIDICIIPHNLKKLEHDGDITKAYEYLASGKPVVSTRIVGIENFNNLIHITDTPDDFHRGIQKYLSMDNEEREKMSKAIKAAIPNEWTWESRTKTMLKHIQEARDNK